MYLNLGFKSNDVASQIPINIRDCVLSQTLEAAFVHPAAEAHTDQTLQWLHTTRINIWRYEKQSSISFNAQRT
jgi:hypothetical protein